MSRLAFLFLLPLLPALAQEASLPKDFPPLPGLAYAVLPLPDTLRLPPPLEGQVTGLRVLLSGPGSFRLPPGLAGLPREVRRHLRAPRFAPMLVGPNWAYLPGLGWTDNLATVGTLWRVLHEAWKSASPLR